MSAFLRFLVIGGLGFVVDAGLTLLLIRAGLQPWQARVPAIVAAMAWTWLANRRFTYQASQSRPLVEAGRYATVALVMACGNYLLFLALVAWGTPPFVAVVVATACQTVVSFWAYKRFVFGGAA
jgi:putative flippase GtrA